MTYLAVGSEVHDPLIDDRHQYYANVVHHGCVSAVRRLAQPIELQRAAEAHTSSFFDAGRRAADEGSVRATMRRINAARRDRDREGRAAAHERFKAPQARAQAATTAAGGAQRTRKGTALR